MIKVIQRLKGYTDNINIQFTTWYTFARKNSLKV